MDLKLKKNLEKRGYRVVYISDVKDALKTVMSYISLTDLVAWGGSKTVSDLGIKDYLIENNYNVLNREQANLTEEEVFEIERQSFLSDIYITSSNAIAKTGELVNIDGKSNRVAAQIFGPKQVFIIAGINKICDDLDQAMKRAQEYASPLNAKRFEDYITTGCMKSGKCSQCTHDQTICRTVVVTRRAQKADRSTIFLINENLGF